MSFIFITLSTGILSVFFETTIKDIRYPYTYSQEMAEYINNNVPKNSIIFVDASIMAQAIIPYLDDGYTLYDITYQEYVTCANVAYEADKIANALSNLDSYRGQYLIICNDFCELDNCEVLYKSKGIPPVSEIKTEYFTLYFIPY